MNRYAVGEALIEYARGKRKLKMLGIDEETLGLVASEPVTDEEWQHALNEGKLSANDYRAWSVAKELAQ